MSMLAAFALPHPPIAIEKIGRGEERNIQSTIDAYHQISKIIADIQPDTIIISSPHAPYLRDGFFVGSSEKANGDFSRFNHPEISYSFDVDKEFAIALREVNDHVRLYDSGDLGVDHGVLVPLEFIHQQGSYHWVILGISTLSKEEHRQLGIDILSVSEKSGKKIVFIASGDLSHRLKHDGPYGYIKEGAIFDKKITDILASGRFELLDSLDAELCEKAGECGLLGLHVLSGVLKNQTYVSQLISYEGPFGVGYAVASYILKQKDPYVDLARRTIEHYVKKREMLKIEENDNNSLLSQSSSGVFVSIHRQGRLRGCIGTIEPVRKNLGFEIMFNAVAACARDPRFYPVSVSELKDLDISVDILTEPKKISSKSELDVKRFGVIV
ncbi:MAG: class III extradiol ring-cleavage dioxygenase family protein, partial [Erysipelotrichaceae bacterium]|nr:class III extradiol ring-cleavage dioxygenase family protein [Erysipelotrichaceae bacterium]